MKRILIGVLLVLGLAGGARASDVRLCTAALVTEGVCPDTTVEIISAVGVPADMDDLLDALSDLAGWTATIICNDYWVSQGECTNGQRGDPITNPVTEEEASLEFFVSVLRATVVDWRIEVAEATAAGAVDTNPLID